MSQIKNIVFDIGNVLAAFKWKSKLIEIGLSEEVVDELGEKIFKTDIWLDRDRGTRSELEYMAMFIYEVPHLEEEIRILFDNITELVVEYEYSSEWVKTIKEQGYHTFLLSNYSKVSFENDARKFKFLEHIEGGVISYQVKRVKPEPTIYNILLDKYNIKAEESLFIDDLAVNIEAAKKLGFRTIHATTHEEVIKELEKLGIKSS